MKRLNVTIYSIFITIFLSACSQQETTCQSPKNGKAVLVAYRVAKHSHLWFENPETKQIHDIGGVGGRREPNINLGDTIPVQYCNNEIILDKDAYVKEPYNRETRFIHLNGYSHLYP